MADRPPSTPLQRSARRFRRLAYVAAALAILCVISELLLALAPLWHGGDRDAALKSGLGQAVLAVPVVLLVWGLGRARRLFRRIEAGELFEPENSRDFARVGWAVVAAATWSMTISGMVPPQTGALAAQLAGIGAGARDLAMLALGFAVVAIGQIVAEGRRLQVDNDSFL